MQNNEFRSAHAEEVEPLNAMDELETETKLLNWLFTTSRWNTMESCLKSVVSLVIKDVCGAICLVLSNIIDEGTASPHRAETSLRNNINLVWVLWEGMIYFAKPF